MCLELLRAILVHQIGLCARLQLFKILNKLELLNESGGLIIRRFFIVILPLPSKNDLSLAFQIKGVFAFEFCTLAARFGDQDI